MTMNEAVVRAPCGALRGAIEDGVHVFRGIPYAAPAVGDLRWRAPQAAARWDGVRDALGFGADFPQAPNPRMRAPRQDDDCLYLNVWTPGGTAQDKLPVMVWIHGGGFAAGSGSDVRSDGARLAARGVVVVSFNYRSGLFGFLAHPALSAESPHGTSGNWGLLDQVAALQWVQGNIAAFGGDPGNVTVFGVSAGSASISLMLASRLGEGLFHQAILQSPGAGRPLATLPQAEQAGLALGTDIAALRRLSAAEVFALTSKLTPAVRGLTTPRVLRPIRDGRLLPEDERPVFESGRIRAMPIIVGSNTDEGTLLTRAWPIATLEDWRTQIASNFPDAQDEVMALYPAASDADARARVAQMFADTQFNAGTRLIARAMAQREPRTWRYLFTHRLPGQADGPHHGEEMAYVFGNLRTLNGASAADAEVSRAMMDAWAAFARSGDPNVAGRAKWRPYDPPADNHLAFGERIVEGAQWRRAPLDFIDGYLARR
jgi:para-nitrobenzyl esterase